jgi:protocatechuate 3,4-dioxygenase beta subunit
MLASVGVAISAVPRILLAADDEPRFTPPPPEQETEQIKAPIDEAAVQLHDHADRVSEILCAPKYMPAHEWPRFRKLIEDHAPVGELTVSDSREPGEPIVVTCTVVDTDSHPIAGASIYLYHTSAKGWYSDKAPHISGNSGDIRFARLFGYAKTDERGEFTLRTIRPGGYPRSDLPQHIHIHVDAPEKKFRSIGTEILFEDDPRLVPASARERAKREGFYITPVERGADGAQRLRVRFMLQPR